MSPRQRREQLKNLLLLIRNADVTHMSASARVTPSLLPDTMQAIREFVSAVPSEHELNQLFGLDPVTGRADGRTSAENQLSGMIPLSLPLSSHVTLV